MATQWICCQTGAREHYAIPRALLTVGVNALLVTDFWAPTQQRHLWPHRLRQRSHPNLPDSCVTARNAKYLRQKLFSRLRRQSTWQGVIANDDWFKISAANQISTFVKTVGEKPIVFAYSYAAREIFLTAQSLGLPCVLGQIDPGPEEMRLVQSLESKYGIQGEWPPSRYWTRWKEECELASKIIVNSDWSRKALITEGVPSEKIIVVPLAYENRNPVIEKPREPKEYDSRQRLKILFLGQVLIRKGIKELATAAAQMADAPVEWHIVGGGPQVLLDELQTVPNVVVHGSVSREECVEHYLNADVFVLPTHSDGFAITQLEAFSYGLPVIASRFCGNVVDHLHNGIILDQVTEAAIIAAVQSLLDCPELLTGFQSSLMESPPDFSISRLGKTLAALGEELTNQTEAEPRA